MTEASLNRAAAPLMGLATLLRLSFGGEDLGALALSLLAQIMTNPSDTGAEMDVAILLQFMGYCNEGMAMQAQALRACRHFVLPAQISPARIRLLALMAPGKLMANAPVECLVEGSDVDLHLHYVYPGKTDYESMPPHDVLFVAIAESQANQPYLEQLSLDLAHWPRPVLNRPDNIPRVARDLASRILRGTPGIAMPPTEQVKRNVLMEIAEGQSSCSILFPGGDFPIIIRPLDSHAGHDLFKAEDHEALMHYLATVADGDFYVSPFVDYRSCDGMFRKYRIALINGQAFACHMAISSEWMVHYLNAGMADSAEKRVEEARFMATFEEDFACRHETALRTIYHEIGLDYVCIDCAETADGTLLIFEIDHAMIVHALDSVDVFPYKQPQMRKVFEAFRVFLGRITGNP